MLNQKGIRIALVHSFILPFVQKAVLGIRNLRTDGFVQLWEHLESEGSLCGGRKMEGQVGGRSLVKQPETHIDLALFDSEILQRQDADESPGQNTTGSAHPDRSSLIISNHKMGLDEVHFYITKQRENTLYHLNTVKLLQSISFLY